MLGQILRGHKLDLKKFIWSYKLAAPSLRPCYGPVSHGTIFVWRHLWMDPWVTETLFAGSRIGDGRGGSWCDPKHGSRNRRERRRFLHRTDNQRSKVCMLQHISFRLGPFNKILLKNSSEHRNPDWSGFWTSCCCLVCERSRFWTMSEIRTTKHLKSRL